MSAKTKYSNRYAARRKVIVATLKANVKGGSLKVGIIKLPRPMFRSFPERLEVKGGLRRLPTVLKVPFKTTAPIVLQYQEPSISIPNAKPHKKPL